MKHLKRTWALLLIAALALARPGMAGPAPQADSVRAVGASQIYLTWHAPYGSRRATDTLTVSCDTTGTDTLWLAFKPGKMSPTFLAFSASILFRPAPLDSLSEWWLDDGGKRKAVHLELAFDPTPGLGYPSPFHSNGAGGSFYWREGNDMRLKFGYATPLPEAVGVTQQIYALARIVVHRPQPGGPGCGEPVCIMVSEAQLNFYIGTDHEEITTGANRFVSLNSPGGAIAVPYRAASRTGWRLKTP